MPQNGKKLMTIGETAKSLGITRRIILNYESKGLLPPDKKDGATGNRYYTADSVSRIRTIRILQNLGLSLDEIYAYYNSKTDLVPLISRLEKLRDEISLNIEKLKERVKRENDFEIKTTIIPAQTVYCKKLRTETIEDKKELLREIFITAMQQYGSDTSKRMFFIEYPLDDTNLITYCIAIPPENSGKDIQNLSEEKALSIFYHGSYESLPSVREQLLAYAKENEIPLKGTCRHIYLEGPPQHKDPAKFITQIALPIQC